MKKFTVISMAAMAAAMFFGSCNSNDVESVEDTASNVAIYSFSLSKNDSVLENLDTVFFSIDLDKAQIFNADSLPYGTPTNKLVPVIRTFDKVSKAELKVTRANGTDTVYDYLTNYTDTIDFSNGPVLFTVASPNGDIEATYTIKVNVHQVMTDSLVWGETSRTGLPSALAAPKLQHTVKIGNTTYCLTTDLSTWSMSKRQGTEGEWESYASSVPAGANIDEMCANEEGIFIVADGEIYKSSDEGRTWGSTGVKANYIYGAYGNTVLYSVSHDNEWFTGVYPGGAEEPLPSGMPVMGTSQFVNFSFPLAGSVVSTMIGGRDGDDLFVKDTWGYDGTSWARISTVPLPNGFEGMILVPYFSFTVSELFQVTEHSILLAFSGRNDDYMNDTVYLSNDCGRTWQVAGSLMQLPDYFPEVAYAQAYIETLTLGSRSAAEWLSFPTEYRIPGTAKVMPPFMPMSRATEPITTWDCPYIYFYGGMQRNGTLSTYIWRGVINRLTFKPIL